MRRYDLSYHAIPLFIQKYQEGDFDHDVLSSETIIREFLNTEPNEFDPDDFFAEERVISQKRIAVMYRFPEPAMPPEALYAALFIDTATRKTRYYTLEQSLPDDDGKPTYMVGGVEKPGTHLNHGHYPGKPDMEEFYEYLLSHFEKG